MQAVTSLTWVVAVAVLCARPPAASAEEAGAISFVVREPGKPAYELKVTAIKHAADAHKQETTAAAELGRYLSQMTGARIPVRALQPQDTAKGTREARLVTGDLQAPCSRTSEGPEPSYYREHRGRGGAERQVVHCQRGEGAARDPEIARTVSGGRSPRRDRGTSPAAGGCASPPTPKWAQQGAEHVREV